MLHELIVGREHIAARIADIVGVSPHTVTKRAAELGVTLPRISRRSNAEHSNVRYHELKIRGLCVSCGGDNETAQVRCARCQVKQ